MAKGINPSRKFELSQRTSVDSGRVLKTLRIVHEDGRGTQVDFGYKVKRFKCKNGCEHHNHMVCVTCGRQSYLDNSFLEDLQDSLAQSQGFIPQKHDFQIYGLCRLCR